MVAAKGVGGHLCYVVGFGLAPQFLERHRIGLERALILNQLKLDGSSSFTPSGAFLLEAFKRSLLNFCRVAFLICTVWIASNPS